MDVLHTTQDGGSQLGAEGIPDTVLSLHTIRLQCQHIALDCGCGSQRNFCGGVERKREKGEDMSVLAYLNSNALLAIDGLADHHVLGNQDVLLAASNKHS